MHSGLPFKGESTPRHDAPSALGMRETLSDAHHFLLSRPLIRHPDLSPKGAPWGWGADLPRLQGGADALGCQRSAYRGPLWWGAIRGTIPPSPTAGVTHVVLPIGLPNLHMWGRVLMMQVTAEQALRESLGRYPLDDGEFPGSLLGEIVPTLTPR